MSIIYDAELNFELNRLDFGALLKSIIGNFKIIGLSLSSQSANNNL